MRALVTGGAGFIGSHVVDRLIEAGIEPVIYDQRPSPHHPDVPAHVAPLSDRKALAKAVKGCHAVLHLAAMADVDKVTEAPTEAEDANSRGTLNVLDAAREAGVERVVYASTIWVYSDAGEPVVDEDTTLGLPAHFYTATKLAGEMYCRSYAEHYGLDYTILRFGIPYGPRCRPEAVVPKFVGKALRGEPLTVAGDGSQSRRFVYVEDLAEGVVKSLKPCAANRVYNLVGDEDVTILDIAETVRSEVAPVELERVPGRSGDLGSIQVSGERAAQELDWRADTNFARGIREYVAWHREELEPAAAAAPVRTSLAASGVALTGALLAGMFGMVLAFLWLLKAVGAQPDDLHAAGLTTMIALTVYTAVTTDGDSNRRYVPWLLALVSAALIVKFPHDVIGLLSRDVDHAALALTGAVYGVVTAMATQTVAARRDELTEAA
jgi:UDP-glucose 4-epimerase